MPSNSRLIAAQMNPVSLPELVRSSRNPRGYVRVSTDDQNPDLQFAALAALGLKKGQILYDQESGTNANRRDYVRLCQGIRENEIDLVAVNRIDRLGRDHYELISFFRILEKSNCILGSVCEPFVQHWKESSWAFRATWDAIGDARYELLRLKERQRQGIEAKKEAVRNGLAEWKGRGPDKKPRRIS